MKKKQGKIKLNYKEGTWFAVPLNPAGFAVGRVARLSGNGCILIYLFGPKRERVPTLEECDPLKADQAVKAIRAGDLGLLNGSWPVIGDSLNWERTGWPMTQSIRQDELSQTAWRETYSPDNPNLVLYEERIPYDPSVPADGLHGYKAAEFVISKILET